MACRTPSARSTRRSSSRPTRWPASRSSRSPHRDAERDRPSSPPAWSPPVPERSDEPAPFPAEEPSEPQQYEPPTQEQPAVKPDEDEEKKDDEGGSDWRTWSGRSVNPVGELPQLAADHPPRPHAPLEREPPQLRRRPRAGEIAHGGDLGRRHRPEAPQRLLDPRMAVARRLGAGGQRGVAQPLVRRVARDLVVGSEPNRRRRRSPSALEVGAEPLRRSRSSRSPRAAAPGPVRRSPARRRATPARCPFAGARAGSPRAAGG